MTKASARLGAMAATLLIAIFAIGAAGAQASHRPAAQTRSPTTQKAAPKYSRAKNLVKRVSRYLRRHSLKQLARRHALTYWYRTPSAGRLTAKITAKVRANGSLRWRKVTIAKGATTFTTAKLRKIEIKLTARARKLLRVADVARFAVDVRFRARPNATGNAGK